MSYDYNELVALLDKIALSKLLLKSLRISQETSDAEFQKWIRLELHGYWNTNPVLTEDVVVPEYRTVAGYYTDDFGRVLSITDPNLSFVNEIRLRFGVLELEGYDGAKGPLSIRPLEFTDLISKNLGVRVTTFNFYPNQVTTVLAEIKTALTDYLMTRKNKLELKHKQLRIIDGEDILEIKPNFYGVGINLRALFRKLQARGR